MMHFTNWAHATSVTVVSSAQTKLQQILLPKHIRDGIKLLTLFFFLILLSLNDSEPNVMLMMKLNLHYLPLSALLYHAMISLVIQSR